MTRLMYDSVTAAHIPPVSELVAGYIDGTYRWSAADWSRHAGKVLVRVAVDPRTNDGHVLDIEPGNADASACVEWVRMRRAAGLAQATIYCFSDAGPVGFRISDVREAFRAAGEAEPLYWIAQWDDDPSTFDPSGDPRIIAKQYAGSAQTGGHYDASVVADYWPGVDEAPMSYPVLRVVQSADLVLAKGEVGSLAGTWRYSNGQTRSIVRKVVAHTAGRRVVTMHPPVDPDADSTEDVSAEPAIFVVDVTA